MGLFEIFKKNTAPRELLKIGIADPICPHCGGVLNQKPAKKKKCPHCGESIYVRTRPQDQVKVLVTDQQAKLIEEQWSIVNGTHEEYLARKKKIQRVRSQLTEQFGKEPPETDVEWVLLEEEAKEHFLNGNWGHYRNARFQMAEVLRKESKLKKALFMYCWVCYLDLNGPRNTSGLRDPQILREFPPFSHKEAFLAPGIISRMLRIIEKLNLNQEDVASIFLEAATHDYKGLKLPIQPKDAWLNLNQALFG